MADGGQAPAISVGACGAVPDSATGERDRQLNCFIEFGAVQLRLAHYIVWLDD